MENRKVLKSIVHFALIGILLSSSFPFFARPEYSQAQLIKIVLYNINLIGLYWINVSILIPNFIHLRKYKYYFISITLLLFTSLAILFIINYNFPEPPPFPNDSQFVPKEGRFETLMPKNRPFLNTFFFLPILFQSLIVLGFGTTFELISLFDKERKLNDEMAKQKAIGELNFLKNQINPHFLLNALNNIYSLARKKSDETTSAVLLLSDLLRHVLYESGKTKIAISQEIIFIKNYINLEKLKFSDDNAPNINFSVSVKNMDYPIEPLLMMTLVENAFKHGISYLNQSFILLSLEENEEEIRFSVINSIAKKSTEKIETEQKGLGIKTLEKQMNLIYPGRHSFKQIIENKLFKSFLTIRK